MAATRRTLMGNFGMSGLHPARIVYQEAAIININITYGALMPKVKQINHVAVVVEDMEKALAFWRDALGMELHELRDVPAEKSQVAFLPLPGSEVELVKPITDDSGIAKYLAKRGPGMHHLCLEVDDIEAMMAQLKSKGIRLINEEPRLAVDGKKYAFIHPESTAGVLVELYQI
jgi:methylmalonyl-CoA/ethylmalonyl-CoA epimerase